LTILEFASLQRGAVWRHFIPTLCAQTVGFAPFRFT